MLNRPPEWHNEALCAQVDPDLWFPEKGANVTSKAVRICQACPVRVDCLEWAVENGEQNGTWGGVSERRLRSLVTARRATRKGLAA